MCESQKPRPRWSVSESNKRKLEAKTPQELVSSADQRRRSVSQHLRELQAGGPGRLAFGSLPSGLDCSQLDGIR